jgi:hypothetical protein
LGPFGENALLLRLFPQRWFGRAASPGRHLSRGHAGSVYIALIECDAPVEQAEADRAAVIAEANVVSRAHKDDLTCSERIPGPCGRGGMSDRYGCIEGLHQSRAEMLTQVEPVVGEAAGTPGRLDRSRSSLGGGKVNLRLPPTTTRMGGRAADATCPV